jgi:hypothetical protein
VALRASRQGRFVQQQAQRRASVLASSSIRELWPPCRAPAAVRFAEHGNARTRGEQGAAACCSARSGAARSAEEPLAGASGKYRGVGSVCEQRAWHLPQSGKCRQRCCVCGRTKCSPCAESNLTPPSSGRPTACFACLRSPLMSNVSRHMQSSHASGSAVERRAVLRACAVLRSIVSSREVELAQPLCRAARPAAGGAPIVEAPPEQTPASCRAVRPSAASAPMRKRAQEQEFGGHRGRGQCFSAQGNSRALPRPCEYAAPALFRSCAAAGIGRAAHAGVGVGSIRRMQMPQALRSRNRRAVCEQTS